MARKLENWLTAYAKYTDISEAPEAFDFWTGVSSIAGALRRQVYIDEIKFKLFPNFYIFFVAPPGIATKSTTVSVGMKLLRQVEGVVMGPSSMTWQGLARGLQNAQQLIPMSDPNTTDPLNMEYLPQSAITCEVSELGTFLDMRNGELISVLIDLWDGKDVPFERWLASKDDTKIENPFINIIGSTTPSWLDDSFTESTIGGGLTSRIIFVHAEEKRRYIPFISDLIEPEGIQELEKNLVHDLREVAKLKGKFTISRDARNCVGEWYEPHCRNIFPASAHIADPRFAGYRARKFAHLLKLAMILSVSESDSLEINVNHVVTAFGALTGIEHSMSQVLGNIGKVVSSKQMDTVLAVLKVRGKVEKHELWRSCLNSMSYKEFGEALDGLVQAGYAVIRNEGGTYNIRATIKEPEKVAEQSTSAEQPAQPPLPPKVLPLRQSN